MTVEMELDDAPREVDVPQELASALADAPGARSAFDTLSFTHRKEYAGWIAEAKREETRRTRVEKAVAMLRGGVKTPYLESAPIVRHASTWKATA